MATFTFTPGIIDRAKAFHRVGSDQELAGLIGVSQSSLARAKAGAFVPSVAAGLVRSLGLGVEVVLRVVDEDTDEQAAKKKEAMAS